jgi:hypothetical protein
MTGSDAGSAVPNLKEGGGAFLGRAGSAVAAQPARPPAIAVEYRCCHALQVPIEPANPALRWPRCLRLSGCLPSRGLRREAAGCQSDLLPPATGGRGRRRRSVRARLAGRLCQAPAMLRPSLRPNPCQKLLPIRLRSRQARGWARSLAVFPRKAKGRFPWTAIRRRRHAQHPSSWQGTAATPAAAPACRLPAPRGKAASATSPTSEAPRQDRLAGRKECGKHWQLPGSAPAAGQAEELAPP